MTIERQELLKHLAGQIVQMKQSRILRVSIDGVDGAGKTTLADELVPYIEEFRRPVIRSSIDGFHLPKEHRYRRGRDSPEGFYFDSFDYEALNTVLLKPLSPNGDRQYRSATFDWRTNLPVDLGYAVAPQNAILLFDGIFSQRPELFPNWDLRLFLDVSFEETLKRTLQNEWVSTRSSEEKRRRFWVRYAAGQKIYIESVRPRDRAHIVIDNGDATRPCIIRGL